MVIVCESDLEIFQNEADAKATARVVCNWIFDVQLQDGTQGQITVPDLPTVPQASS
jgi:hypothetical protein